MSREHRDQQPSLLYVATVAATIHQFLVPLAAHFRSAGWRVGAAAASATEDPLIRDVFNEVNDIPLSRSIRRIGGLVRGERAIGRLLIESMPDVVHVHSPIASFMTRFAVRRMPADQRPAIAYTAHGFHFHRGGRLLPNTIFLAAEKVSGRWTDRLVVINDEDQAAALRHRIVHRGSLIRMPGIGLDTDHYARTALPSDASVVTPPGLGSLLGAAYFVVVGEFSKNKRQVDALAALARLRDQEVRLILLGDGQERGRLRQLAVRLDIADRVVFAGIVDDVRPIVASSVALMLNSGREGLARSVMEALALEVPVIASTARGNRELVGDSGRIVEIGDVDGYADAMEWMLEHPTERQAMGVRGRRRMVERYDSRIVIKLHEELYSSMLAERSTRVAASRRPD